MVDGAATIRFDKPIDGFANEVGGHRIQRVPAGDRRGRVHSSTVTVSLLEGPSTSPTTLDDVDLSMRWFSGTGAGGQHRNKHQNSVELVHLPTGISRTAQTRSRVSSLVAARSELEAAVVDHMRRGAHHEANATRAAQIGSGMRADKRRTYRFRDDLVSDDLTGRTAKCSRFMKGELDLLWR